MTLTTHALVGAAAAQLFPTNPYLAFAAGFASHFAIDALPHWDYDRYIKSFRRDPENPLKNDIKIGKQFFLDLCIMGSDALLGIVASIALFSYWVFETPLEISFIGAVAGIFPDGLQFVYFKTRSVLLKPLQRFHIWVQEGKSIYPHPLLGMGYQAGLVAAIIAAQKIL